MRVPLDAPVRSRARVALAHVAAAAAIVLFLAPGLRDVPISRDEGVYHRVARGVQEWLRLMARSPVEAASREAIERFWGFNHEHPGLPRLLPAASALLLGGLIDPIAALRAGNALLAVLVVLDCFHFMRRRFGAEAAWFAAVGLLLVPYLYGHACIAAMDFPVAAFGFLATTAFVRGLERPRWAIAFAFYLALALNSKINAAFVPLPLVAWALAFRRRACLPNLLAAAVLTLPFWILAWPWLWHDSAARLVEYFQFHRAHHNPNAAYFGEVYVRRAPPWHYVPFYLVVATPLGILLPAVGALAGLLLDLARRRAPQAGIVLLALALVTPVILCAWPSVPRYDGPRLFLNAFPFIACLAGVGFARGAASIGRGPYTSVAGAVLGVVLLGSSAFGLWRVHPFEPYSYYDALIGGPSGALRLGLSPVLWAMADRQSVEHLNRHARRGDVVYSNTGATLPLRAYRAAGLLRGDLRFGERPHWVVLEYNLAYAKWRDWQLFFDDRHPWFDRVLQIEAANAPVLGVFRARSTPRGMPRPGLVQPP